MSNLKRFIKSQYFIFSILLTLKAIFVHGLLFHDYDVVKAFILEGCYIFLLLGFVEFLPVTVKSWGYFAADALITTVFTGIILYGSYFNIIPTYFALFELGQVSSVSDSVLSLLNPLYLLLYLDIMILVIFRISKKLPFPAARINKKWLGMAFSLSIIIASLAFMHYRSDDIANPVLAAEDKGIFNYELLNIYKNPSNQTKPLSSNLTPAQINHTIQSIKGIDKKPQNKRQDFGVAKGRNVIVIQLESFEDFLIGLKVNGQTVTPNLNKLVKKSLYFPDVYQQVGPGNTSDAEFMMNTSLFPESYSPTALSEGDRAYPSLPKLLGSKGYNTMTFHADELKFWNRDELYPGLGFNHYYEQPLYGQQDIVGLGPSDDVLYGKTAGILNKSSQPFYAQVVSLSSHHPYKIPASKQGLSLPAKYNGSIVGDYLQAQHYTDASLGRFIDQLKAKGLWNNSVIMLYGDHFGLSNDMFNSTDESLMKDLIGHPYTKEDRYNIPLIAAVPGKVQHQTITKVGGQLDFLPTLTNLLGIPIDHKLVHFGQDILNTNSNTIGMRYYMPEGSFINKSIIYEPDKSFSDGTAINRLTGKKAGFKDYHSEYEKVIHLEDLSDAYIQSLPVRSNPSKSAK